MARLDFPDRPPRLALIFQKYRSPVFFVTFCTYRRRPILASAKIHSNFETFCQRGLAHNVVVGRYVIMPDHVHLFVCGGPDFRLGGWIKLLKQSLGKALKGDGSPACLGSRIWQEGFFDHLLRNDESMGQKWDYVFQNPVRAGLVSAAEAWPYQGEIARIDRA